MNSSRRRAEGLDVSSVYSRNPTDLSRPRLSGEGLGFPFITRCFQRGETRIQPHIPRNQGPKPGSDVLSRRLSCLRINRCLKAIRRPGRSWRRMIRNRRSVKSPPPNVSPPFLRGAAFYLRCTCSVRRTVRFSPLFHASVSLDPQTCDAQVGGARN